MGAATTTNKIETALETMNGIHRVFESPAATLVSHPAHDR